MSVKGTSYIYKATIVSLSCNVVLVLIKSTAFLLVNSLAIAVDLGISVAGLTVSVILYYSMKLANKPADLLHNYGYGKVEHVCEALEGVVLIGIAFGMSAQAFVSILHPKHVSLPWVGFAACALGSLINFGGAHYIFKMAKKSRSPAIHAEGIHYRLEGFISVMIASSFLLAMFLYMKGKGAAAVHVDPAAALLASALIVVPSFRLAKNAFFKLLDASVEEDSQMGILKQLSRHIGRYCEFRDIKTRTSGRKKFVELKLIVPSEISFKKGHQIVSKLEKDISSEIPHSEVLIRMEPCKMDCKFIKKGEKCPYL